MLMYIPQNSKPEHVGLQKRIVSTLYLRNVGQLKFIFSNIDFQKMIMQYLQKCVFFKWKIVF